MSILLSLAVAAALAAQPVPASTPDPLEVPVARFSVEGGRVWAPVRHFQLWRSVDGDYRFTSERIHPHGRREHHEAHLSSCPAARGPLGALGDLRVPVWLPGITPRPDNIVITADGSTYSLWASLANRGDASGAVQMRDRSGSPLAD